MQLATDSANFADGALGMVELVLSFLNDRTKKYWSKAEVIEYLNQSQAAIANRIMRMHREFFLTSATTPTVAGQTYYSLPPDLVNLIGLEVADSITTDRDPKQLVEIPISDREFYERFDKAQTKDDYDFYFVAGSSFRLMPEANATDGRIIRTHYVKRLTRMVNNNDTSEIPEEHHELICVGGAQRALIKTKQVNAKLDQLQAELTELLQDCLAKFSPQRDEIIRPWWGSYGPTRVGPQTI